MPSKIQLYSLATPNGQKVSVALEEMKLDYDAHTVNIMKDEQFTPEFISINPNSKIPAIVDPTGDNGKPLSIFESGAILVYLAEKSGKFLSKDPTKRIETLQWLFFQMGGPGPMFGQFGHFFRYAGSKMEDKYPLERYANETKRLLSVLDNELEKTPWISGDDYSIADMALVPWVDCLGKFYEAGEYLNLEGYKNVNRWKDDFLNRSAVKVGMMVCSTS